MTDSLDTSRQRGERCFAACKGTTRPSGVGDAVTKALARYDQVHPRDPVASEPRREDARGCLRRRSASLRLRGRSRAHVPTKIAERAAATLAMTMQRELALVSPADATLLLARRVVKDLAYHYGFDRMVQALPRESYGHGDLRAVMTAVLTGDPMAKLAARFASRPTGDGLRAPARARGQADACQMCSTRIWNCYGRRLIARPTQRCTDRAGSEFQAASQRQLRLGYEAQLDGRRGDWPTVPRASARWRRTCWRSPPWRIPPTG